MLILMDADNLACACGILGLDIPEGNLKLFKNIFQGILILKM